MPPRKDKKVVETKVVENKDVTISAPHKRTLTAEGWKRRIEAARKPVKAKK